MTKYQTVLYLVRHGLTDYPHGNDFSSDRQRQLTSEGKKQVEAIGRYLSEFDIKAIYSSPLERCIQTANIINKTIGLDEIKVEPKLSEVYSTEEIQKAERRSDWVAENVVAKHLGEQVVCVTHQFIIGYLVSEFYGLDNWRRIPCECADIYQMIFADSLPISVSRLQPAKNADNI